MFIIINFKKIPTPFVQYSSPYSIYYIDINSLSCEFLQNFYFLNTVKTRLWNTRFWNTFTDDRIFYYINKLDFGIVKTQFWNTFCENFPKNVSFSFKIWHFLHFLMILGYNFCTFKCPWKTVKFLIHILVFLKIHEHFSLGYYSQ